MRPPPTAAQGKVPWRVSLMAANEASGLLAHNNSGDEIGGRGDQVVTKSCRVVCDPEMRDERNVLRRISLSISHGDRFKVNRHIAARDVGFFYPVTNGFNNDRIAEEHPDIISAYIVD